MATHIQFGATLNSDLKYGPDSDLKYVPGLAPGASYLLSFPIASDPKLVEMPCRAATDAPADLLEAAPRIRRVISREQGCALETIGHAVDYLNDCYLNEGSDDEILDFSGPSIEAVQILISAQRQILRSLPLAQPLRQRVWNAMLRRAPRSVSGMVALSSSR